MTLPRFSVLYIFLCQELFNSIYITLEHLQMYFKWQH